MPENAYRKGHLWSHLAASTREPLSLARLRRLHPNWPICPACSWPIDPAALLDFDGSPRWTVHPTCNRPQRTDEA